MPTECAKEKRRQSAASPSTVKNREKIVYVLVDPDHWQEGELQPQAFSKSQLAKGQLSVCRPLYCTKEEVLSQVVSPLISKKPFRRLVGCLEASVAQVRGILLEDPPKRAICVVDDGLPLYPAHAVLGFSEITFTSRFWEKNCRIAIRSNLALAFGVQGGPTDLPRSFPRHHAMVKLARAVSRIASYWLEKR
jgi:hypothetical protein